MKDLLLTIAKSLVEDPNEVQVTEDAPNEEGIITYHLHVSEAEMGRIIGKQGMIIKAIRVIMRAAAARHSCKVIVNVD